MLSYGNYKMDAIFTNSENILFPDPDRLLLSFTDKQSYEKIKNCVELSNLRINYT